LYITNPTWPDLGSNPGCRSGDLSPLFLHKYHLEERNVYIWFGWNTLKEEWTQEHRLRWEDNLSMQVNLNGAIWYYGNIANLQRSALAVCK
jgi:hypothetical protein